VVANQKPLPAPSRKALAGEHLDACFGIFSSQQAFKYEYQLIRDLPPLAAVFQPTGK
jgi:hypothetical protein